MTTEPTIIRCSDLDSLFACAPSKLGAVDVAVAPVGDEAHIGTAVHAALAGYVETGAMDLKGALNRAGLSDESDECVGLVNYGLRAYAELKRYFRHPATERRVGSGKLVAGPGEYQLNGTLDVVDLEAPAGRGVFIDWKSGQLDGYSNQMLGYAYGLWVAMSCPDNAEIVGIVVFLRHRYFRVVKYSAAQLQAWEHDLIYNVLAHADQYRPGRHCRYCRRWANCAAKGALVGSTLAALMHPTEAAAQASVAKAAGFLAGITPANKNDPDIINAVEELRFRLALAERVVEDAKGLVRDAVERVGGIHTSDGSDLVLREVQTRVLDPIKAFPVLRRHLSDADVAGAMKLSLPKLLAKRASRCLKGEKLAAMKQLEQELDAAGAISLEMHKRLDEVDLTETQNERSGTVAQPGQPVV